MTVAMINFNEQNYDQLSNAMEKMIESSQCFLFDVLASPGTQGYRWAQDNGAPVKHPGGNGLDDLLREATYFVIWNDGSAPIHRLIFRIMQTNKHGTILGEPYKP